MRNCAKQARNRRITLRETRETSAKLARNWRETGAKLARNWRETGCEDLVWPLVCPRISSQLHFEPLNFPHTPTEMIATYLSLDSARLRPWGHHLDPLRSAYPPRTASIGASARVRETARNRRESCEIQRVKLAKQARICANVRESGVKHSRNTRESVW
jgi:hypothetical protein